MTSEWDKLWEKSRDEAVFWLMEVKAAGDKNQQKLEVIHGIVNSCNKRDCARIVKIKKVLGE